MKKAGLVVAVEMSALKESSGNQQKQFNIVMIRY